MKNEKKGKVRIQTYYKNNKELVLKRLAIFRANHPEHSLLNKARERSKKKSLPFNLSLDDIKIPEFCPLLEIPITVSKIKLSDNSPTLDRYNPELGYVKGNVWIISHKANRIKNNASIKELETVIKNLKKRNENE